MYSTTRLPRTTFIILDNEEEEGGGSSRLSLSPSSRDDSKVSSHGEKIRRWRKGEERERLGNASSMQGACAARYRLKETLSSPSIKCETRIFSSTLEGE